MIDLRSDTVTLPTPGMYEAMRAAPLGNDMAGEDPSVNELEARIARRLGKPAAVFGLSGTMTNQMGVRGHVRPGDELLINSTGHVANYEGGAAAALSGVNCRLIDSPRGMLTIEDCEPHVRPDAVYLARTALLCLENTTNMAGGYAWPLERLREISRWAWDVGLKVHLDGARLFNAAVATGTDPADIAACADTVSVCFSKGLGCPMGSALVGNDEDIAAARRFRKILGGACRQAGVIAGACLYALEHHVDRLAEDHAHARDFAARIAAIPGVSTDPGEVETNLVFFDVAPSLCTAAELSARLRERGVQIGPTGKQRLRACTHLDVSAADCVRAADEVRIALASTD